MVIYPRLISKHIVRKSFHETHLQFFKTVNYCTKHLILAQAQAKAELVPSQPQLVLNYDVDQKQDRDLIIGSDSVHCTHEKKQVWRDIFMLHGFNSFHTTQPDHRIVAWPATVKNNSIMNTPTGASTNPKNFDLNKNLYMNLI